MTFVSWLAFAAAAAVLLVVPGPTILVVVSHALAHGRRVALRFATGVALGDLTAMTISLAGLGAVLAASATLFTVLKWIGAVYLIYLGVRLWLARPELARPTRASNASPRLALHAFAVTALNPKSIAFFVAFVPHFIDRGAPLLPQFVVLEATFVCLAFANAVVHALAADGLRRRIERPVVRTLLNRTGAGFLVGMGAATMALSRS